jgi:hypothetical protein
MQDRRGCLGGLFDLFLLTAAFDWLEGRFGFGRGGSCTGIGCGLILLLLFLLFLCNICGTTHWTRLY